ncbi:MAG TPA: hypothetical protein PLS69_04165, partial [Terricaulis sp.]|nr:hypothetical protein [Terricaulis sp.]
MLPPGACKDARASAANVVVIEVARVEALSPLSCAVHGRVLKVERGRKYKKGALIIIETPAIGQEPALAPIGGAIFQDFAALSASRYGRAYLSDEGALMLSQYEIIK